MATILGFLSALVLVIYTIVMIKKTGSIPHSISETYYRLEHREWFGFCMILTAALFMAAALEQASGMGRIFVLVASVGMIVIGISPNFKEKTDLVFHIIGSAAVLVGTQLWAASLIPWLILLWLLPWSYIAWYTKKYGTGNIISDVSKAKPIFWFEATVFVITYITLIVA